MRSASHEIVRVVQPAFLVNSLHQACRYETVSAGDLASGYYFALWPANAAANVYDKKVRYFGPFETQEEALLVQVCAVYLEIAAPFVGTQRSKGGAHSADFRLSSQREHAAGFCAC